MDSERDYCFYRVEGRNILKFMGSTIDAIFRDSRGRHNSNISLEPADETCSTS